MANNGSSSWIITSPENGDDLSVAAQEIRSVREGVASRINKEHVDLASGDAGGEHVTGSGMAYYQSAAPTERPNSVSFSSSDKGRMWCDKDEGTLWVYSGSNWIQCKVDANGIIANAVIEAAIANNAVTEPKLAKVLDLSAQSRSSNDITLPDGQVLTNPTITNFTNANHDHSGPSEGGTTALPYVKIEETSAAASAGSYTDVFYDAGDGQPPDGSFYTRHLSTLKNDTAGICTLIASTGLFKLPVGKYKVFAGSCHYAASSAAVRCRLLNNSTSSTLIVSESMRAVSGSADFVRLTGVIDVVNENHEHALQMFVEGGGDHSPGYNSGSGEPEIHSFVELQKIQES